MRYLKVFENFEYSGKLKAGMIIEDGYYTNNGTFVIQTNEGEFEIACAGGANVVVSGDSNTGEIVSVDNQFSTITIELEGGEKIVIGGEGLKIYEVEQSEDNTELEKNLNKSDVIGSYNNGVEWFNKLSPYHREKVRERYNLKSLKITDEILDDIYQKELELPEWERVGDLY